VEIVNADGRFVPDGLVSVKGMVHDPQCALTDSLHYALAGEPYTLENFNHHETHANHRRHGFELTLKRSHGVL
jgi:hypothetical protein